MSVLKLLLVTPVLDLALFHYALTVLHSGPFRAMIVSVLVRVAQMIWITLAVQLLSAWTTKTAHNFGVLRGSLWWHPEAWKRLL